MPRDVFSELLPGDALLYSGSSFWSWAIKVKTWSDVSHCEVYFGDGKSGASRDGQGVNTYPLRREGLRYVLRPVGPLDFEAAMRWHRSVIGQRYDWWGLLRFFTIGKQSGDKQFCSEWATRWYRHAGWDPFQPQVDADLIAPGELLKSPRFWRAYDGAWEADHAAV